MHPTSPLAAHHGVRPDDDLRQDDEERSAAPPANALDARRLRSAFLDLYGRPPFLAERQTWSGRGLAELLDEALGNEEFWTHWLSEQLYYFLLIDNFRPQAERVRALKKRAPKTRAPRTRESYVLKIVSASQHCTLRL